MMILDLVSEIELLPESPRSWWLVSSRSILGDRQRMERYYSIIGRVDEMVQILDEVIV